MKFDAIVVPLFLANLATVLAHGSPQPAAAIARRHALAAESAKTYSSCASRVQTRDVTARRDAKTQSFVNNYLSGRGLEPNFDKRVESATTCVLVPEEVEGPYCKQHLLITLLPMVLN